MTRLATRVRDFQQARQTFTTKTVIARVYSYYIYLLQLYIECVSSAVHAIIPILAAFDYMLSNLPSLNDWVAHSPRTRTSELSRVLKRAYIFVGTLRMHVFGAR